MSQASNLSRYRPAIFAITGAAAAYGIYVLYTTFTAPPAKGALHRSNAVHARARRSRFVVTYEAPGEEYPLGKLLLAHGATRMTVDVNKVGSPAVSDVQQVFPDVPQEFYAKHILDDQAVQCVMHACYVSRFDPDRRTRLRECGVGDIAEAMEMGNGVRVLALATPLIQQVIDTDHETIQSSTLKFLTLVGMADSNIVRRAGLREISQHVQTTTAEAANPDIAETEDFAEDDNAEPEHGLKGLLYHIAETDAKRKAYEHRGINCEECGESPIKGVRWHCLNCPDFDLCSTCEASANHQKTHVFVKIKIPLPVLSQPTAVHPPWYPGDSIYRLAKGLRTEVRADLRKAFELDDAHLDACYDQFTSLANVEWEADPVHVNAAIDRQAFNKALTCERWPHRFRPNALYDRMFTFYDTDANSLIGFREFLDGLFYLRGRKRFTPLNRALRGFDFDDDGYVERQDFLRLLQAKYDINKLVVNDMIEAQEAEQTQLAMDTLRSSQPISSIFTWEDIPQGEERTPVGKARDAYGDLQPVAGTKTILEDGEGWDAEQSRRQRRRLPGESHEQLRHHLSRFEELLSSPTDGGDGQIEPSNIDGAAASDAPEADGTEDSPLDQDVIWEITQEGFNQILDRMFKAKEEEDREAVEARPEIEKWRAEIDGAMKKQEELKRALEEEVRASGNVDPLLETAMNSLDGSVNVRAKTEADVDGAPAFKSEIVPTDDDSLTRREEEIAQKPLEDLLEEMGYSAVQEEDGRSGDGAVPAAGVEDDEGRASGDAIGRTASELDRTLSLDGTASPPASSDEPVHDPTMPQHRPNADAPAPPSAVPQGTAQEGPSSDAEKPPSRDRLEYLGVLAAQDREIAARGGPGRLSFEEVEAMVQSDPSRELKGVVTGWLDWASF